MALQQVAVIFLCVCVSSHWVHAVVNNVKPAASSESNTSTNTKKNTGSSTSSDSITANTDKEVNRREIPAGGLSDSYGVPIPSNSYGPPLDSYIPPVPSNIGLPVPVYGVPNAPTKNIVYPAPPPDIPPPLPSLPALPISGTYGPPKPIYGPPLKLHPPTHHKSHFHKPIFGTSFLQNPFKSPRPAYGPPPPIFVPKHPPKPTYGPPKLPKPAYGPPLKLNFVPPKPLFISSKPAHGPIKLTSTFGAPLATYGPPHTGPLFIPPKNVYGPPKEVHGPPPVPIYGPPEPVPHGPPHPGAPAPPTPPDIKYDGWQPIPGLVSRPPSNLYGAPHYADQHGGGLNLTPPLQSDLSLTYASSFAHGSSGAVASGVGHVSSFAHGSNGGIGGGLGHISGPSDSYGAPLNTVTGSGGIVSSSGNEHISFGHGASGGLFGHGASGGSFGHGTPGGSFGHGTSGGSFGHGTSGGSFGHGTSGGSFGHETSGGSFGLATSDVSFGNLFGGSLSGHDNSLSVIKSIGYEILPATSTGVNFASIKGPIDSYGAPPADSYAPDGPYAAAVSQNHKDSISSVIGGSAIGSSGIGLLPPSGIYGVPPGGQYGAPLLSPPKNLGVTGRLHGTASKLNALDINPPKQPVVFREPVPQGLIQSLGDSVSHKDAHGIEHSQTTFQGQAYIPPPIPDITKQKDIHGGPSSLNAPSNLYSLPQIKSPVSFQSVVHGISSTGIGNDFKSSFHFGNEQNSGILFNSYTAPLNAIDSSYGIPLQPQALTANFDHSQSFDLSNFGTAVASTYTLPQINLQSTLSLPHDCTQLKSQPVPQTGYGLPTGSASSYTASISSLNTNIGGQSNYQIPALEIGNSDLQAVHSLPSQVSVQPDLHTNYLEVQGKSLGQEYFGKDADLQQSQEIHVPNDVQNIPIQGSLGSYTLQIQPADGLPDQQGAAEAVPHEQVLSEGLLQSILAAIEQPQQQQQQQQFQEQYHLEKSNQGYGDLQHAPSGSVASYQQNPSSIDGEAQNSVTRQVVVTAPDVDQTPTSPKNVEVTTPHSAPEAEQPLRLIDNNGIALYFNNNNSQDKHQQEAALSSAETVNDNSGEQSTQEVRNGQQYGSYVSFKTPHSSYIYGEFKTSNNTVANVPQ